MKRKLRTFYIPCPSLVDKEIELAIPAGWLIVSIQLVPSTTHDKDVIYAVHCVRTVSR